MKKKKFLLNQIINEPFIDVNIQDLKKWNRSDEIIYAQMQRQKYKYEFFQKAFDLIYDNTIQGDYFEFGVHRARTFRFALSQAKRRNMKKIKFLAVTHLKDYQMLKTTRNKMINLKKDCLQPQKKCLRII